jgi:ketosteroid isomerase-like protein
MSPETDSTSPTSPERRIEMVRSGIEAYNQGDIEAVLVIFAEDVEIYAPPDYLNSGTFHGHKGFLEWVGAWNEAWDSFDQEVESIEPVGERCVIAEVHQTARGRGSGIEIDQRAAYLWEVREDGKCTFQGLYPDAQRATAAAREREAAADN